MLCLTRKLNESLIISGGIKITVIAVRGDKVRLGIAAPDVVEIDREEIWIKKHGGESCGGQSEE